VPRVDPNNAFKDQYILSIVVFSRRDVNFTMDDLNERVVSVEDFYAAGVGGGDLRLRGGSAEQLALKSGDWLMLMANLTVGSAGPPTIPYTPYFRWYRVVETDNEPEFSGGVWYRDATLQGPDWPVWTSSPTAAPTATNTRAALIANVFAVYERTIRLETSSLWSY
jgi:hypothetical protein